MELVKLQILLSHPLGGDEMRLVEARLTELGMTITGRGAVTLSASMPADLFSTTFGREFRGRSGFAARGSLGETLSVPASLRDYVDAISETPRHEPMR
ncbi:MAG TPA: hypothetical protein VKY24_21810 [Reyranella sp.]|nr:hypothetical protein [Reyranella sp.]